MSSTVYQGLQSCLEPELVEPQALGLKLVAPKSHFLRPIKWSQRPKSVYDTDGYGNNIITINDDNNDDNDNNNDNTNINSNDDFWGWSFIKTITNTSQSLSKDLKEDKDRPYVHPLIKHSSSRLSQKSLDLCTENLGCETGSNVSENLDISSFSTRTKLRQISKCSTINNGSYPPPLTSISGTNCLRIRSHREGGRLVMKAVIVPSNTIFKAERIDGCLKLHFLNNCNYSYLDSEAVEEGKEGHYEDQERVREIIRKEVEDYVDEETNDIKGSDEDEMGMEEFQNPSRCKEGRLGNKGSLIWEPFWVATLKASSYSF